MRDLDRQRFEDQQIIASATFDFLSTATAGYKSMAGVAKGIAIAEAWWNTYVAATKALDYGPIMGPIVASLMVAKGTAMVGKINAQKFAEGGIVGGSSYYGDRTPVLANSREMYLNTAQQADLFNFVSGRANMVDKLREKNVGGRTVTLNVNGMFLDQKTVRKISRELSLAESRA